uniref:DUF659 domain-containing protein n=1 Tax=Sipha flava TaxID=143950 RepID=A0A2S2Q4P1_9HEMI
MNLHFLSFQPKGDVLREPSNHLVSEWGIEKNNVVAVTTNSGAYIKNAVIDEFGEKRHIACLAHTINLIVEKCISKTQDENATTNVKSGGVPQLLHKIRCIVKYLKKSIKACDELKRVQKSEGMFKGKYRKLILDLPTRWNS